MALAMACSACLPGIAALKWCTALDISESFVQAARLLNHQLTHPVDALLTGDWDTVAHFCKTHPVPDAVAGTDVIEHIYDVGAFLQHIKALNKSMITVFTTASVTANPFKTYTIKKLQRQDEYQWSNPEHTPADNPYAGLPFLEVRKHIIQSKPLYLQQKYRRLQMQPGACKKQIF